MQRFIQGADGALYGTTVTGGVCDYGLVYRVSVAGLQVIHCFAGPDGAHPWNPLVQGADGALYGAAQFGGTRDKGVVYKLNPDGSGFQVLHSFEGEDGVHPAGGLLQGADGALYGVAQFGGARYRGVVYKLNPDGSGFEVLHSFEGDTAEDAPAGALPEGVLVQGADGALYGSARFGGPEALGVFRVNPDGSGFEVVHRMDGLE